MPGSECFSDEDENHSGRLHAFIEKAPYQLRVDAHLTVLKEMDEIGIEHYNESIYLTDDELALLNK